jgi:hypothetical protein
VLDNSLRKIKENVAFVGTIGVLSGPGLMKMVEYGVQELLEKPIFKDR